MYMINITPFYLSLNMKPFEENSGTLLWKLLLGLYIWLLGIDMFVKKLTIFVTVKLTV